MSQRLPTSLLILLASLWPTFALAQVPSSVAQRRTSPIAVDGQLDESHWQQAERTAGFLERKPRLGAQPESLTEFAVAFDDEALYLGVWCSDPEPEGVVARTLERDAFSIFSDDAISVKLDVASDRRTTLGFVLNPASGRMDYRGVEGGSMFERQFDMVWQGAASRTDDGWSAEMRVPFTSLGLDPTRLEARMGLNLSRDHARRNATYDWSLMPPPYSPVSASLYGDLVGVKPSSEAGGGIHLDVTPYALGALERAEAGDTRLDAGLDVAMLTPGGWQAQLTLNTDFAQVDLDDQVINLDRFSLFLPEKRGFFLRDGELFDFGESGRTQLFFSRRIGLGAGTTVPILGGLRLTGRAGDTRVGLVEVVTRPVDDVDVPWTNHTVARARHKLGGGSTVGAMATWQRTLSGSADSDNAAAGLDARFGDPGSPLEASAYGFVTQKDQTPDADAATTNLRGVVAGASVAWRGESLRPTAAYRLTSEDARADLGFLRRTGVHEADVRLEVEQRIDSERLERASVGVEASGVAATSDGRLLDAATGVDADLSWNSGVVISARTRTEDVTVRQAFSVGNDTAIEAGAYRMTTVRGSLSTPSTRVLSGGLSVDHGDFFGGTVDAVSLSAEARPSTLLRVGAGSDLRRVRFGDDRRGFDAVVVNGKVSVGFTPDLGLDVFVAWNRLDDLMRAAARLRWTWTTGSDLFVVAQEDFDTGASISRFRTLVAKLTWRL